MCSGAGDGERNGNNKTDQETGTSSRRPTWERTKRQRAPKRRESQSESLWSCETEDGPGKRLRGRTREQSDGPLTQVSKKVRGQVRSGVGREVLEVGESHAEGRKTQEKERAKKHGTPKKSNRRLQTKQTMARTEERGAFSLNHRPAGFSTAAFPSVTRSLDICVEHLKLKKRQV